MKVTKRDTYTLNTPLASMNESDLRDLKFGLNFRWLAHVKKGHTDAAERVKAITDLIRQELAQRAQNVHLKG